MRTVTYFAIGALVVAGVLAVSTYVLVRGYLFQQRIDAVTRHAAADAVTVSTRLGTTGTEVGDVLSGLDPLAGNASLVHRRGEWFVSSLDVGAATVPASLVTLVASGTPGQQVVDSSAGPVAVVGVPLPSVDAELYEVAPLTELQRTLTVLAFVLGAGVVVATSVGVGVAVWSSRRLLDPLHDVARVAARIAGGDLESRLTPTDDPDLVTIVASFNSMADAVTARIDRDARFAADASHELRTPLTALTAAVELLEVRREEFGDRQQQALDLVTVQLARFRRLLDDLIELAREDVYADPIRESVDVRAVVQDVLRATGRPETLVVGAPPPHVLGDRLRLERVVMNLFDNADKYGGGVVEIGFVCDSHVVHLHVDDAGPGIPPDQRERVFERFARGGTPRGADPGTGLGLAIVRESVRAMGGRVSANERPGGGARIVVDLMRADT